MKIFIFSIILILNFNNGCTKDTMKEVSLAISKQQLKEKLRSKVEDPFNDIRMKLIESDHLNDFQNCDTLFFLETYEYESGTFYGRIWNLKTSLDYTYHQGKFSFGKNDVFTSYACELVEKWDIKTIRKEEKENSTMINPFFINGSRVILKENKIKVDCIGFDEFFLLERDK